MLNVEVVVDLLKGEDRERQEGRRERKKRWRRRDMVKW